MVSLTRRRGPGEAGVETAWQLTLSPTVTLQKNLGVGGLGAQLEKNHVARLQFPREAGLILRCAGKAGNPFQTTQGRIKGAKYRFVLQDGTWDFS